VGDTIATANTPQILRATELNLCLCQLCTEMMTEINYKQLADLRESYKEFRMCMMELYYLVRLNKEIKNHVVIKKIGGWKKKSCTNKKIVSDSVEALKLYDEFSEVLANAKIL